MDRMQTSIIEFLGQRDVATLLPHVVRLVAQGEPVALDRLAAEAGLPIEQVESRLKAEPGVDWDSQGHLLGFGLTQRQTAHRFIVGDHVLYAFCAADTLMFPVLLGRAATVESRCAATGQQIHIDLTPEAVMSVDPSTAVVSQVCLCSGIADIRATVCDHGHFFATADAAKQWSREHPDGEVRPVGEFFARFLPVSRELGWAA